MSSGNKFRLNYARARKITENCPTVPIHYLHRLANFTAPGWRWARHARYFLSRRALRLCVCVYVCTRTFIIARTCARGRKYSQPFIRATGGVAVGEREARTNEFTISSNFLVNRRYTRFRGFTGRPNSHRAKTLGRTEFNERDTPGRYCRISFSLPAIFSRIFTIGAYFPEKIKLMDGGLSPGISPNAIRKKRLSYGTCRETTRSPIVEINLRIDQGRTWQ